MKTIKQRQKEKKMSENNFWKVMEGRGPTVVATRFSDCGTTRKNTLGLGEDFLNSEWWIAGSWNKVQAGA